MVFVAIVLNAIIRSALLANDIDKDDQMMKQTEKEAISSSKQKEGIPVLLKKYSGQLPPESGLKVAPSVGSPSKMTK